MSWRSLLSPAAIRLWLFTNLAGCGSIAGLGPLFGFYLRHRLDYRVFEWLVTFAAVASLLTIPGATLLFCRILPLPRLRRLWLAGLGILALWGLPVGVLSLFAVAWVMVDAIQLKFTTGILSLAAFYLPGAYLSAAYVYRTGLFRPDVPSA